MSCVVALAAKNAVPLEVYPLYGWLLPNLRPSCLSSRARRCAADPRGGGKVHREGSSEQHLPGQPEPPLEPLDGRGWQDALGRATRQPNACLLKPQVGSGDATSAASFGIRMAWDGFESSLPAWRKLGALSSSEAGFTLSRFLRVHLYCSNAYRRVATQALRPAVPTT